MHKPLKHKLYENWGILDSRRNTNQQLDHQSFVKGFDKYAICTTQSVNTAYLSANRLNLNHEKNSYTHSI